jgi:hypothetical protein
MTRGQTVRLKQAFLKDFAQTGNVTESCANVGIDRRATVYDWQELDDQFAAGWREAELIATEVLETEARRRAVDGQRRLKFDKNGQALIDPETERWYVENEKSDTLLIFLLKARAPEKYRDKPPVTIDSNTAGGVQIYLPERKEA